MKIKVNITNQGFLLLGAGEGSAMIDADTAVTKAGFPYFPGKIFKGLMREAVREVLEIRNRNGEATEICNRLFGKADGKGGPLLVFSNLYLEGLREAIPSLAAYKSVHEYAFDPGRVTSHFTWEVSQTAIGDDGVAKDRSLRNFRAVKPKQKFTGEIEIMEGELPEGFEQLIEDTERQLRYAGTKRNRGFGRIEVQLEICRAEGEKELEEEANTVPQNVEALEVTISTKSAVVLSAITSDQNTVSSDRHVRGSRIWGIMAEKISHLESAHKPVHKDALFRDAILSGKIQFHPGYPRHYHPAPLNLHKVKGKPEEGLLDVFRDELLKDDEGNALNTRTVGGMGKLEGGEFKKVNTPVSAQFHSSRTNRTAGRNMENDDEGGIFYYEGVDAQQTFQSLITGDEEVLKRLCKALPSSWAARIGKSKSVQYGEVIVRIAPVAKSRSGFPSPHSKQVLLHLRSPALLYNDMGLPACNEVVLQSYLSDAGIQAEITKAAAKVDWSERWNREWNSRTNRMPVYKEGSVFLLEVKEATEASWKGLMENGLGEMRNQGFGWVEVEAWEKFPETLKWGEKDDAAVKGDAEGHIILDKIVKGYAKEKEENKIRLHALGKFKERHRVPNHLLSRLEQKMDAMHKHRFDLKTWQKWLDALKDRPAGDALKRKKLYEPLHEYHWILPAGAAEANAVRKHQLAHIGWKAFFKMIRIRNKKQRKNGN